MTRALVLGGGGPVGIGWETAVLAGLLDGGWMGLASRLVDHAVCTAIVLGEPQRDLRPPRRASSRRKK